MSAFRKLVPGAACAAFCSALILTGMPAQAATPEAPVETLASWHQIWGPQSHDPAKSWSTPDFVPQSPVLGGNFRCWDGGDGTDIKAALVRTRDSHVMTTSAYFDCDGSFKTVRIDNARSGEAYYMRISLKGKAHTIEAKAYYYR
jgi:hypothetical protein